MSDTFDVEQILSRLKTRGLRLTTPRRGIIETLYNSGKYLSADEIYGKVNDAYPGIGLATIYRTLIVLTDMGILTKFEFGEGKARYELAESETGELHHHVLVCTDCLKVTKYSDFSPEERQFMAQNERFLEQKYNFTITRHVVQFYGHCHDCKEKGKGELVEEENIS